MNIEEHISVKLIPASKKLRKVPGYWNWPELIALAEKAIATGEVQSGEVLGTYYAIATPDYSLIKSAQTPEYLASHEKVRIVLFHLAFTFGVENGETIPCPYGEKMGRK